MLATGLVIGLMALITGLAAVEPSTCGGGWGAWSVPINTLLLIGLAVFNYRTRRRVEAIKDVTDTVALRKEPRTVRSDRARRDDGA